MPRPDRSLRIPAACNACGRLFVSISGQKLLGHRVQVFETIVPTVGAPWLAQDRDPPRRRLISSPVLLGFPMPGRKMSISPGPKPSVCGRAVSLPMAVNR